MKRYFNHIKERQVMMIEYDVNSIVDVMDVCKLFGASSQDIVEVSKSEYRRLSVMYKNQNETNLSMTISR